MKIVIKIQLKIVIFTAVKNRCILNGRVFVMSVICHFRLMFWTEHGNVPAVKKSNMDGSSVSVIISENIYWPNGIAIDHNGKGLCLFFISPLQCFIEILKLCGIC